MEYLKPTGKRLRLSSLCEKVLRQDCIFFNSSDGFTLNGIINRILVLFLKQPEEPFALNFDLKDLVGNTRVYRCGKELVAAWNDVIDDFNERYDLSDSDFCKLILESYSQLSFAEREAFILSERMEQIRRAISQKYRIRVSTFVNQSNDKKAGDDLVPYKIVESKEGSFSYLIAIDDANDFKLRSIRISHIKSFSLHKGPTRRISSFRLREYDVLIAEFGPTFVEEETMDIVIRFLNETARRKYEYSVIHRPIHTKILDSEKMIYEFHCSLKQAQYFFFYYTGDIDIISPRELKDRFIENYKKGLDALSN